MMRRGYRIGLILGAGVLAAAASAAQAHGPGATGNPGWGMGPGYGMHQGYGWGMMGPGHGYGMHQGYGWGMMGPGHGHGWGRGPGMSWRALPENLTEEQVRHMLEHEVQWSGNDNLKVGKVEKKDEDTIIAEVVTQDGAVVRRYEVNRHTGYRRQVN